MLEKWFKRDAWQHLSDPPFHAPLPFPQCCTQICAVRCTPCYWRAEASDFGQGGAAEKKVWSEERGTGHTVNPTNVKRKGGADALHMRPLKTPRIFRHGSGCMGWNSVGQALTQLGVHHACVFGSEKSKSARQLLRDNFDIANLFQDIRSPAHASMPEVQLFDAGFPCQSYSSEGLGHGLLDERGQVIFWVLKWIKKLLPGVFILENVKALTSTRRMPEF